MNKYSQFNSIISLSPKFDLLYNAYSDRFVILTKALSETLANVDVEKMEKNYSNFYEKLLKAGCIIDKDTNEVENVKKIQEKVDNSSKSFNLIINPTLNCNFKCWYCYESHVPKSKINDQTFLNIKLFILNVISKQEGLKHFSLGFFGGEPLLHYKQVKEIISYTNDICSQYNITLFVAFTTNGYLINKEMIRDFRSSNVKNLQITLDGNKNQHDKVRYSGRQGSFDKIIQNINLLLENQIGITLRINYTTENISGIKDILQDIYFWSEKQKTHLDIQFHRVWQDSKLDINDEVDKTIDSFLKHGFKAYKFPLDNVKKPCYADTSYGALINYNGDVYRCTALNFAKTQREGFLNNHGRIVWENESNETRKNAKFKNKSCLTCRILPVCNGGCSQKAIEYKDSDYCIFRFNEDDKNKAILDKLKFYLTCSPYFKFS